MGGMLISIGIEEFIFLFLFENICYLTWIILVYRYNNTDNIQCDVIKCVCILQPRIDALYVHFKGTLIFWSFVTDTKYQHYNFLYDSYGVCMIRMIRMVFV